MADSIGRRRFSPLPWLAGVTALLSVIGLWDWVDRNFERRVQQVSTGWSAAARRNPFLAAERFLAHVGVEVESASGRGLLREPPPPTDMLVVKGGTALNNERRRRLRAWLEQGGRLLMEATQVSEPGRRPPAVGLLADYGVVLRASEDVAAGAKVVAAVDFPGHRSPVRVAFTAGRSLEDVSGEAVGGAVAEGRSRLLRYRVGRGLLTVVSDADFLTNRSIGELDHALALALLSSDVRKVWLLHDHAVPGLAEVLWRAAPEAVIAAVLLLAAVFWHQGRALGPRLPPRARARRDLTDHLEAASALIWRYGLGAEQMERTRRRIEQAWLRRHPLLRGSDRRTRARWIAEQAGVAHEQVFDALYGPLSGDVELTARSRALQRIRYRGSAQSPGALRASAIERIAGSR